MKKESVWSRLYHRSLRGGFWSFVAIEFAEIFLGRNYCRREWLLYHGKAH